MFVLGDLDAGERCDHCSQSTDIDAAPVRVDLLAAVESSISKSNLNAPDWHPLSR